MEALTDLEIQKDLYYREKLIYNLNQKLDWKKRYFLFLKDRDYDLFINQKNNSIPFFNYDSILRIKNNGYKLIILPITSSSGDKSRNNGRYNNLDETKWPKNKSYIFDFDEKESEKTSNDTIFKDNENNIIIKFRQSIDKKIKIFLSLNGNDLLIHDKAIPDSFQIKETEQSILNERISDVNNIFSVPKSKNIINMETDIKNLKNNQKNILSQQTQDWNKFQLGNKVLSNAKKITNQKQQLLDISKSVLGTFLKTNILTKNINDIDLSLNEYIKNVEKIYSTKKESIETQNEINGLTNSLQKLETFVDENYYKKEHIKNTLLLLDNKNVDLNENINNFKTEANKTFYTIYQADKKFTELAQNELSFKKEYDNFKQEVKNTYHTKFDNKNQINDLNIRQNKQDNTLIEFKLFQSNRNKGFETMNKSLLNKDLEIEANLNNFKEIVENTYQKKTDNEKTINELKIENTVLTEEIKSLKNYITETYYTQIQINDNTNSLVKSDELNEKNITELKKTINNDYYKKNQIDNSLILLDRKNESIKKNIEEFKKQAETDFYTVYDARKFEKTLKDSEKNTMKVIDTFKIQVNDTFHTKKQHIKDMNQINDKQKNQNDSLIRFKLKVSKEYETKKDANSMKEILKIRDDFVDKNINAFKETVKNTYQTKFDSDFTTKASIIRDDAINKNINDFRKTVQNTYETKADAQFVKKALETKDANIDKTINDFKKTVENTYETKTDAKSVKKTLEEKDANIDKTINDFKKKVENTYQTKTDADTVKKALENKNKETNDTLNDLSSNGVMKYDRKNKKYIVGEKSVEQTLNISRGNLSFIPYSNNELVDTGGNNEIVIDTNHWTSSGDEKSATFLYFTQMIDGTPRTNRRMELNLKSGRLKIQGGVDIDDSNDIGSDMKRINFKNVNNLPSVYFESGFYIKNTQTDRKTISKGGEIIIKNTNNVYRPVNLSGHVLVDNLGNTTLQTGKSGIITSNHIQNDQILNRHIPDKADIEITKTNLQLGRGLAWEDDKTLYNATLTNLHNYHDSRKNFICKFICLSNFKSTEYPPLISKKDVVLKEIGPIIQDENIWGKTNNTEYYIFRPWGKDKALELSNILEESDFDDLKGSFDIPENKYYKNWSISLDISMNKDSITHSDEEWVALMNITGTGDADIYLLDGQAYIKGNGFQDGGRIGDAGKETSSDTDVDIVNQSEWTNILFTFEYFIQSDNPFVNISFYRNGKYIGQYTPPTTETNRFRLLDKLLLFNEKSNDIADKIYTGYGWVKNIALYKKTLTKTEALKTFESPEQSIDSIATSRETDIMLENTDQIKRLSKLSIDQLEKIESQNILIKNLENITVEFKKQIETLQDELETLKKASK